MTAFETLGAPRVGHDPDADAWARQVYRRQPRDQSEGDFLRALEGFWVLDLVPPCDGLPRYSNGSPGGYVEAYALRAQFLRDCADDLGEELLAAAYESKLANDTLAYGRQLLAVADDLIHRYNLDPQTLGPDQFPTIEELEAGIPSPTTFSPTHARTFCPAPADGACSGASVDTSSTPTGDRRPGPPRRTAPDRRGRRLVGMAHGSSREMVSVRVDASGTVRPASGCRRSAQGRRP